jgi:hypothetical protein
MADVERILEAILIICKQNTIVYLIMPGKSKSIGEFPEYRDIYASLLKSMIEGSARDFLRETTGRGNT